MYTKSVALTKMARTMKLVGQDRLTSVQQTSSRRQMNVNTLRYIHTHIQTDIQTQTYIHTDRQTERQTQRHTDRQIDRQTQTQ